VCKDAQKEVDYDSLPDANNGPLEGLFSKNDPEEGAIEDIKRLIEERRIDAVNELCQDFYYLTRDSRCNESIIREGNITKAVINDGRELHTIEDCAYYCRDRNLRQASESVVEDYAVFVSFVLFVDEEIIPLLDYKVIRDSLINVGTVELEKTRLILFLCVNYFFLRFYSGRDLLLFWLVRLLWECSFTFHRWCMVSLQVGFMKWRLKKFFWILILCKKVYKSFILV